MSDERVEGSGKHAKSADVHVVKIQEAEECPNFLQGRGSFPILHALDFDWIHSNGVFANDNTEILHFGLFKLAFLRFEVEIVDCEDAQDIIYHTTV